MARLVVASGGMSRAVRLVTLALWGVTLLLPAMRPAAAAQIAADRPIPSAPAARSVPVADSVRPDLARTPRVEAQLVAARTAVESGEALWVALRLKMIPHWHTYWRNPGDSGEPTALDWSLPAGFSAEGIRWPAPMRLPAGPLMNYGYEGEVLLPVRISVPASLPAGPVTLAARASWLVCNPEQCIPEDADLAITLEPGPAADTAWAAPIRAVLATLPAPAAGWGLVARATAGGARLQITPPAGVAPTDLAFFPYDEGRIDNAAPQALVREHGRLVLDLARAAQPLGAFDRVHGLLVSSTPLAASGALAVEVDLPVATAALPAAGAAASVWLALVFAFAGGLILNLMPCVLPVLSIKVLGFAREAQQARGAAAARAHGLLYAAGVILSFWVLAGVLLALKAAGAQFGWGFQLQSPLFVAAMAMLFFVIALNLSGVFEFGRLLPARLASLQARGARADAFLTGVLAVLIASPCTAPFMGAALGYALAESAANALAVFTALGIGMALPYVLLAWHPAWLAWVPRPGPWMIRLRQLLAFPIYATVIWLAWVLGVQSGLDAVIVLAGALLALGLAALLAGWSGRGVRWTALALAVCALGVGLPALKDMQPAVAASGPAVPGVVAWESYTPARLAALRGEGRPVFVDFTAAWCVTCQVNKKLVLETDAVAQAFRERGVTLMRADWTRRDADITRALAELGRSGVPVYVLYAPGEAPRLLPELLSREVIESALAGLPPVPRRDAGSAMVPAIADVPRREAARPVRIPAS